MVESTGSRRVRPVVTLHLIQKIEGHVRVTLVSFYSATCPYIRNNVVYSPGGFFLQLNLSEFPSEIHPKECFNTFLN